MPQFLGFSEIEMKLVMPTDFTLLEGRLHSRPVWSRAPESLPPGVEVILLPFPLVPRQLVHLVNKRHEEMCLTPLELRLPSRSF